jgi:ABC-type Mn2+/Zn2+ transport system ATPase subunit
MAAPPLIHLRDVAIGYGAPLLPPLSLRVEPGQFLGVVGPNGGGKSTLVKTMCGILKPVAGKVETPGGKPRIGYVPQRDEVNELFPLSAAEVVRLNLVPQLSPLGRLNSEHRKKALTTLERVGLSDQAHLPFRDLSGGQKQRVLLARALVIEPDLLVLDEPTAALDPVAEQRLMEELSRIHQDQKLGIVLVSHQLALTAAYAQCLAIVHRRRDLFRVGPTQEIIAPQALKEIFGAPAKVQKVDGHWVIHFESEGDDDRDLMGADHG